VRVARQSLAPRSQPWGRPSRRVLLRPDPPKPLRPQHLRQSQHNLGPNQSPSHRSSRSSLRSAVPVPPSGDRPHGLPPLESLPPQPHPRRRDWPRSPRAPRPLATPHRRTAHGGWRSFWSGPSAGRRRQSTAGGPVHCTERTTLRVSTGRACFVTCRPCLNRRPFAHSAGSDRRVDLRGPRQRHDREAGGKDHVDSARKSRVVDLELRPEPTR
jgi:hypothetical protein